ncbi:putative serine/threonine-protein kinase iksA [Pseudocercospora fuligena]|uniref:non-specific serine/threonine protein kinase n=1 Tax=Pseudocercospora fuligena TaxID=685502 RepID=A0A8H6VDV0_9PEZI|nr:putative serine/threonine-protein kinase iksA [Pseudocercospora fuligena]
MADETPPQPGRQLSLVPYASDSRDIVLRRGNAVVLYDAQTRQLSVRDAANEPVELTDCPYCHRPLRNRDRSDDDADHGHAFGPDRPFVDQDYFAMLAASQRPSPAGSGFSTPSRRVHPAIRSGRSQEVSGSAEPPSGAQFVGSEPSAPTDQGISSSAFSPGYFQQFFREERELGRGGNGVVLLVEHMIDGVSLGHFACKRIPVGDSRNYFEKVIVEVRLLQKIPHKNLVAYHWTWLEDYQPSKFGPSIPCLWILQDYCNGGDLHTYVLGPQKGPSTKEKLKDRLRRKSKGDASPPQDLRGPSKLSFEEIFSFFRDITSGLHHLHSKGYIHRDLKPSNCLLQRDGNRTRVLISDFGEVQAAGAARLSSGATGTISYCAPEVLLQNADGSYKNFTTKSDIFSLGMIVYFMCFGRLPYTNADDINEENEDLEELRAEIQKWTGFNDETRVRPDLPERLFKYLKKLLSVDPNERPSTEEILTSIKGGVALGEAESVFDDFTPRVSNIDSPAPKAGSRNRKHSFIPARPGLSSPGRHYSSDSIRSRSPMKQDRSTSRPTSPQDLTVTSRKMELPPAAPDQQPHQQSPRLMLPPPPARPAINGIMRFVHSPRIAMGVRAVLFAAKIFMVSIPCAPYSANQWLLYPLLGLAAIDLGFLPFGLRQSILLFIVHVVAVVIASQHSRLCEVAKVIVWEDI